MKRNNVITAALITGFVLWLFRNKATAATDKAMELADTFLSIVEFPAIRNDAAGSGAFGSSRDGGSRKHDGVDLKVQEGQAVHAPFPAKVVRYAYPYADNQDYKGLVLRGIEGTEYEGLEMKIFYVDPFAGIVGAVVPAGAPVAFAQAISQKYGNSAMTDHIHVELRMNNKLIDPTPFLI